MDLRKSVLRYLHSVFDTDPAAVPAIIVENETPIDWRVAQTILTVDGKEIDLSWRTLSQVSIDLRGLGYAAAVSDGLSSRSAASLLDDFGSDTRVHLMAQNSVLWAISMPGALAQLEGQRDIVKAVRQLNFMAAGGGWLDLWGRYFDVPRLDDQSDADYAAFIRREVLRQRSNAFSIQIAVKDWTGREVVIREPWREIFIWGKSRWDSADARWQDGNFYTFGTLEPRGTLADADWDVIVPVIQRNRAMGCYMLPPVFALSGVSLTPNPGPIPVAFALGESMAFEVTGELLGDVGARQYDEKTMVVSLLSDASQWAGNWDGRTWGLGGRSHDVGFVITDVS